MQRHPDDDGDGDGDLELVGVFEAEAATLDGVGVLEIDGVFDADAAARDGDGDGVGVDDGARAMSSMISMTISTF